MIPLNLMTRQLGSLGAGDAGAGMPEREVPEEKVPVGEVPVGEVPEEKVSEGDAEREAPGWQVPRRSRLSGRGTGARGAP